MDIFVLLDSSLYVVICAEQISLLCLNSFNSLMQSIIRLQDKTFWRPTQAHRQYLTFCLPAFICGHLLLPAFNR